MENEFRRYIECGILAHGFVRVHCAACRRDELVAFSYKGRAICPSCIGRRMSDTAARLVDQRLPDAPYRQWVFSFPRRLRVALAYDATLWSEVLRACVRKVFVYQRRRARALGIDEAKTLAVGFAQRFGSLIPPPRQNQIRYYGLLASQAHDRDRLLTLVPSASADSDRPDTDPPVAPADSSASLPAPTGYRIRWAKLLARVFGTKVLVCPACRGARTIIAAITERDLVTALLTYLELPTDAPELAPARAPPQPELFSDHPSIA